MPLAVYVPSRITEFVDVPSPTSGDDGKALTYNHSGTDFAYVAFEADGAVAGHEAAGDPHAGYLLATGTRAGATSQAQTFTNGLVTGTVKPASDSTTAVLVQNAAGSVDVLTVDTSNARVAVNGAISSATFTVNQHVDVNGIRVYGYDDKSSDYIGLGINAGGSGFFSTTGNMIFLATGGTQIRFGGPGDIRFTDASNNIGLIMLQTRRVGLGGVTNPTALCHLGASTTSNASLCISTGTAPTSPNDGDIWYPTSGRLTFRRASTTELIATGVQASGGSATAAGTYGSNEQTMLQSVYDAARAFGLLT